MNRSDNDEIKAESETNDVCVEMEVDKEPMDLSNSSRTSLATTELVDSPIFTTFISFSVISYFYFISTAPPLDLYDDIFNSNPPFTVSLSHITIY